MLEKTVTSFRAGVPSVLKVTYLERGVAVYHSYSGGQVWIPTAPEEVGHPDDILTIRVESLRLHSFVDRFTPLEMANEGLLA